MTKKLSPRLKRALEVFEIGELDLVISRKDPNDLVALRELVSMAPNIDPEYRQRAIYALGRWGDTESVPRLAELMSELDEHELITAVDALGRLGTRKAREAIEACADHPSPDVRKSVVNALSRIGGTAARSSLRRIAKRDSKGWIRSAARRALDPK